MRLGDPAIVMLALSSFGTFAYTVKVVANSVTRLRDQRRKIEEIGLGSVSDERFARLESAVEAIAIEVERISEGQRFTTRLLTEHKQQPQLGVPRPGKFDTPH